MEYDGTVNTDESAKHGCFGPAAPTVDQACDDRNDEEVLAMSFCMGEQQMHVATQVECVHPIQCEAEVQTVATSAHMTFLKGELEC